MVVILLKSNGEKVKWSSKSWNYPQEERWSERETHKRGIIKHLDHEWIKMSQNWIKKINGQRLFTLTNKTTWKRSLKEVMNG